MLTLNRILALGLALGPAAAHAGSEVPPPPPFSEPPLVSEAQPSPSGRGERPFRVRLGILGGASMQKTQFEIGAAWDFLKLSDFRKTAGKLRLGADFSIGVRPNEVSLLPMVGVRFTLPVGAGPFELALGALGGVNVTVMRGGTGVALPIRLLIGGQYLIGETLGIGLELGVEVGPLVAPFSSAYAAGHVTAVLGWGR